MKKEDEKDIALANFIESLIISKLMRNFFQKSNKMIAVSYIVKRKIKKIFFEVISNSKIFNIIFFQRNCQRPRFSQNYRGGLDKGGGLDSVEYGIYFSHRILILPKRHP